MPTIADYLKFANLQMAAEALFDSNAYKDGATLIHGKKYTGVIDPIWLTDGTCARPTNRRVASADFLAANESIERKVA